MAYSLVTKYLSDWIQKAEFLQMNGKNQELK